MTKRVFIVHGWGGSPEEGWFPWLKKELKNKGFEVQIPKMPDTDNPTIELWVSFLKKIVGKSDSNTYFVGHSIGCQTILRYLESLPDSQKSGGVVLVAPWIDRLESDLSPEEKRIAEPWIHTPIDLLKIKEKVKKFKAIFSDNDMFVRLPEKNQGILGEKLEAEIIVEHSKGHFSGSDGITELSSALNAVLEISGK